VSDQSRKIKPTLERVDRMLQGERERLARLEQQVANCRANVTRLEATKRRLAADQQVDAISPEVS